MSKSEANSRKPLIVMSTNDPTTRLCALWSVSSSERRDDSSLAHRFEQGAIGGDGEAAAGDQGADMHERDERANGRVVGVERTPGL